MIIEIRRYCSVAFNRYVALKTIRENRDLFAQCDTIDLRGRVYNYPAIGLLIDAVWVDIKIGADNITIIADFIGSEDDLLPLLLAGSARLHLPERKAHWTSAEIRAIAFPRLGAMKKAITVLCRHPFTDEEIFRKSYGT